MLKRPIIHVLVVAFALTLAAPVIAQRQPSRLIVVNQTKATVELFTFVDKTWQNQGRINPGASTNVYNVANGQQFRARWGSNSRNHAVTLVFNRDYGGLQDVFTVQ